ncbi:MAG: hypothetical protein JO002_11605, partial [Burkholderiaceae bacterium]|nr:hypothetical protein [Burkholderiaceae bacterium]
MASLFPWLTPQRLFGTSIAPVTPAEHWQLKDGRSVTLRAACADDAQHIQGLVRSLSPRARYMRFF